MRKRRPRLVPKVVFRVAFTAAAIPAVALACKHDDSRMTNPVACCGYGVAARAYTAPPPEDQCPAGSARVHVGDGNDGGTTCLAMGVAAIAYERPKIDASAAKPDAAR